MAGTSFSLTLIPAFLYPSHNLEEGVSMPGYPLVAAIPSARLWFLPSIFLLTLLSLAPLAWSGEVVYRYVDDQGVATFSSQRDTIPLKYQGQVQALDAVTFQPVQDAAAPTAPPEPEFQTPAGLSRLAKPAGQATPPVAPQPIQAEPAGPSWLDRFAGTTIPLPSQFQLGVGLTALVLIVCAVMVSRMLQNLVLKLLLRTSIMLLLGGSVYLIYFSGMNERLAETTRQPGRRTTTGKELLGDMKGKADQMKAALDKAAAPVTGVIEKTKAATLGEADQAVNAANQSNQQLDKRLREIEANP
ncbi:MAG: DUF4124 domain-containing protein [Nitrospirae bacterium]|nr:MAG: DUF4124 domain-containing protein [Nitrospirota bacterium]